MYKTAQANQSLVFEWMVPKMSSEESLNPLKHTPLYENKQNEREITALWPTFTQIIIDEFKQTTTIFVGRNKQHTTIITKS